MAKEKKNRFTRKDYDTMVSIKAETDKILSTSPNDGVIGFTAFERLNECLNEHKYTYEQYGQFLKAYNAQVKGETPTTAEISQIINIMNL